MQILGGLRTNQAGQRRKAFLGGRVPNKVQSEQTKPRFRASLVTARRSGTPEIEMSGVL